MYRFRVSASGGLAPLFVAAYLKNAYPGSEVETEMSAARSGVRVELNSADRWLLIGTRGPGDESIAEAIADGACAVVTIDSDPDDLDQALSAVLDGETFVPEPLMRQLATVALGRRTPESALTAREAEVLRLVARGYSNNEIADALVISPNTVRSHLHALSVKLKASSRTKMLANARVLNIAEAFELEQRGAGASSASA